MDQPIDFTNPFESDPRNALDNLSAKTSATDSVIIKLLSEETASKDFRNYANQRLEELENKNEQERDTVLEHFYQIIAQFAGAKLAGHDQLNQATTLRVASTRDQHGRTEVHHNFEPRDRTSVKKMHNIQEGLELHSENLAHILLDFQQKYPDEYLMFTQKVVNASSHQN